jgi:hypothetical protein
MYYNHTDYVLNNAEALLSSFLPVFKAQLKKTLDDIELARHIVKQLEACDPFPLSEYGLTTVKTGVYVIYYTGDFPLYKSIAHMNRDGKFRQPIYCGKGSIGDNLGTYVRKCSYSPVKQRLSKHYNRINAATNLCLDHFHARALGVDSIECHEAERLLIEEYKPMWNLELIGFGRKATDAKGLTRWDSIHPAKGVKMVPLQLHTVS